MPPLVFDYSNGVSNMDEVRLPQGFCTALQNFTYDPDDRDRIFKIFGRQAAGSLPGPATAANTFGFDYMKFSNNSNKFLILTNSQLYETAAATTLGAWSSVVDKQAVPVAFPRAGTFLKTIPSGDNRYIIFTGAGERPLIRDEDGDWHYLGMNKPAAPDLTQITSAASYTRPTTQVTTSATGFGTQLGGPSFANPTRAYDNDLTTYANYRISTSAGIDTFNGTDWIFTAAGTTAAAQKLYVVVAISGLPPANENIGSFDSGTESGSFNLYIQLSIDTGATYTTIYIGHSPLSITTVSADIAAGVTWANIRVRVIMQAISASVGGPGSATAYVYEIYAQPATTAGASFIDAGTYYYGVTEVYQVTLASGKTRIIEGPPSDPVSTAVAAGAVYGVTLTLSAAQVANILSDGYKHDPTNKRLLYRNIYRTTKSGTWPDLGYIGTAAIDATSFIDNFAVSGSTLGTPGINVVYAGIAALNAANPAPAFLDAAYFRGAIIGIPAKDPFRIQWSLPGYPDYWPQPAQDLGLLPTARNDQLVGIGAVGEYLVMFTRTRLLRLRDLAFVDRPNFDVTAIQVDILSPNEGLAGGPLAHCAFQSEKGYSVLAWVSDSGIWMTDGSLPSEGGLGIVKLTANLAWRRFVDVSQLSSSRLIYDPILQMVLFDYYDLQGNRRTLGLHTASSHWVAALQGSNTVPKVSGPHTKAILTRVTGDFSGAIRQWSLSTENLKIYNERTGVDDDGIPIFSVMETGWTQPAGPQEEYICYLGSLYHSDWGPSETCDLDLLCRRDDTGVIQEARKRGVPLAGVAVENFHLQRSGKSFKLRISHSGRTTSTGQSPQRALGPVGIDGEVMDALFGV